MNLFIKRCFLLLVLLTFQNLFAQEKSDLEGKKKLLQKEIKYTESLLNETKTSKKLSLNQLVTLNKKISIREDLIKTINSEIKLIDKQIHEIKDIIEALEKDILNLKEEYAKMIYYAHKNRNSYDRLMFVFSSTDFNQAYNRLKHLQQYSEFRKKQADLIVKTKQLQDQKIEDLTVQKQLKRNLLSSEEQEKINLASEKNEQETILTKLQKQEKDLLKSLKEKEKEKHQLQLAIQRIIEEEIRKAKEAAILAEREKNKTSGTATASSTTHKSTFILTPEAQKLSATFESNRTKLPWPVIEGVITGKFGTYSHPVLRGIVLNNNGIDISTKQNAAIRAVFSGEVTGIAIVPGFGKVVMIRHGEYLSVYSKLKDVSVKKGDKISTKQIIGIVETDDDSKTEVHFEIWKGTIVLNPELWLFKDN